MRNFEHLLVDLDDENPQTNIRREYGTCFWVAYGISMMTVGAVSMWLFFHFVVLKG
jgi:hypothetical protein